MIRIAAVAFTACVSGGASGCSETCWPAQVSYLKISGELVDSDSGERLSGVPLELRLEGEDGPIGGPAAATTETIGVDSFTAWVETGPFGEECVRVTGNPLLDMTLLYGGITSIEQDPDLEYDSEGGILSDAPPPPTPTRAILTVDLDGSSTTITVEIDEDVLCSNEGTVSYCLGSIPVAQSQ